MPTPQDIDKALEKLEIKDFTIFASNASEQTIKETIRKIAKKLLLTYHPDKYTGSEPHKAEEMSRDIIDARKLLIDVNDTELKQHIIRKQSNLRAETINNNVSLAKTINNNVSLPVFVIVNKKGILNEKPSFIKIPTNYPPVADYLSIAISGFFAQKSLVQKLPFENKVFYNILLTGDTDSDKLEFYNKAFREKDQDFRVFKIGNNKFAIRNMAVNQRFDRVELNFAHSSSFILCFDNTSLIKYQSMFDPQDLEILTISLTKGEVVLTSPTDVAQPIDSTALTSGPDAQTSRVGIKLLPKFTQSLFVALDKIVQQVIMNSEQKKTITNPNSGLLK